MYIIELKHKTDNDVPLYFYLRLNERREPVFTKIQSSAMKLGKTEAEKIIEKISLGVLISGRRQYFTEIYHVNLKKVKKNDV